LFNSPEENLKVSYRLEKLRSPFTLDNGAFKYNVITKNYVDVRPM